MLRTTLLAGVRLVPAHRAACSVPLARPQYFSRVWMSTRKPVGRGTRFDLLVGPRLLLLRRTVLRRRMKARSQHRLSAPSPSSRVEGDWVLFHPVYSAEELKAVEVLHREATTIPDKLAYRLVRFARWGFDFVSRYKHRPIPPGSNMSVKELREGGYILDERGWLSRILFLETIAGVPGMVAGMLRHLQSIRLMRRDNGWIHTCLQEAENERMHLMTFMTLRDSPLWFRALILGAQGVFFNMFFFTYLISPRTCHRFVGYLEEEAVLTYTRCIEELERGWIPEWADKPAPEIAIDYWRLRKDATLLDVIYAVRSDETTHRFVNHSLANLVPDQDVNPFALQEPGMDVKGGKIAFDRKESEEYMRGVQKLVREGKAKIEE
ncbi:Alternative oxidase [Mycena chlorophos]|uniref:Alternative oxidase n=1 Tax=Mycena chlorophos TaxID=658473 RepID=A0A8H6TJE3_MYCCL|nr:Alternative oxidase [Mycena chlorophos]